jgi:hypothetical protein
MKRIRLSQRKSVTAIILILTVFFLAPVTALAGEADIQKSDIQKPDNQKYSIRQMLPKNMEIAPNKPGAQFNYLFKFEVPVELQKVHPSVNKAAIYCFVSNSEPSGPSSWGQGLTEIPLQGGTYTGIINVYITGLAYPEHKPELIDQYECGLVFFIDGIDVPFVYPGYQSGKDPIGGAHKFGSLFQPTVKGKFY